MFLLTVGGEAVGYSEWPWDRLYAPAVGCFARGRLRHIGICNLPPQRVGLEGPDSRSWFRMALEPELLEELAGGNPAYRIARLEDASTVPNAARAAAAPSGRVEDLLALGEGPRRVALDGFPAFLTAPEPHQLDILYMDILGRAPDPVGREAYLNKMRTGAFDLLKVRDELLESEERQRRNVTLGDRLGSLLTSHLWRQLAAYGSPGKRWRELPRFRVGDYRGLSTEDYVGAVYELLLRRPADPQGLAHYAHVAERDGRFSVAWELSREAAHAGVFIQVVDT